MRTVFFPDFAFCYFLGGFLAFNFFFKFFKLMEGSKLKFTMTKRRQPGWCRRWREGGGGSGDGGGGGGCWR